MKKRKFVFQLQLIAIATLFTFSLKPADKCNVDGPRFAVLSDVHFINDKGISPLIKVPQALGHLIEKDIDALFVCGDLTNSSTEEEWKEFRHVFDNKNIVPENLPVYFMMGNHDFYTNPREVCEAYYMQYTGQPLHQYIDIKGYLFITISMCGRGRNHYSPEAILFLKESLHDAATNYPGKPIFVFTHVPPSGTVYGSNASEGNWGTEMFEEVLKNYPQVIIFAGHSHFPLGDPRSIHQGIYTSVNDGSTTYGEVEPGLLNKGIHPENSENVTEGLIVNVDQNMNVILERWDTFRNEEILPRWYVNAPHDGSSFLYKNRDGLPAPVFKTGIKPEISNKTLTSFDVSFPQAWDNEVVHHYIIEVINGETVEKTFKRFSEYYLNSDMPASITVSLTDVPANIPLKVRIIAVDSYFNESEPIVSEEFRL